MKHWGREMKNKAFKYHKMDFLTKFWDEIRQMENVELPSRTSVILETRRPWN